MLASLVAAPTLLGGAARAGEARVTHSLARRAAAGGRYYGAAVRIGQIEGEPSYRAALLKDCSWLTPEIDLKWDAIERVRGARDFAPVDALLGFADANAIKVHGHTLIWEQSTPGWARDAIRSDGDWTLVADHFAAVLGRYRRRIARWDVVNEPIDTEAGRDGLRRTTFHRAFGPDYIARALREARRLAPDARLMINDYGFDYDNTTEDARRARMLRLVRELRADGVPLDGIGIQAHLDLSKGAVARHKLASFIRALAALDLEVAISELDVKETDRGAPLAVRDARVASQVADYLDVVLAERAVTGVTTWGLSDRHSWLQDGTEAIGPDDRRLNRGLPYDAEVAPKAMYWAMERALGGTARA